MIEKTPLIAHRHRRIQSSFAAIEHRFPRAHFWVALGHHELLLISSWFWSPTFRVCPIAATTTSVCCSPSRSMNTRPATASLTRIDGWLFQVLSPLPATSGSRRRSPLIGSKDMLRAVSATVSQLIAKRLGANHDR